MDASFRLTGIHVDLDAPTSGLELLIRKRGNELPKSSKNFDNLLFDVNRHKKSHNYIHFERLPSC
jgi:hypothetical protein